MNGNTAKIVLAVGVTALFTAIVLVAAFIGYLYFRAAPETATVPGSTSRPSAKPSAPARRAKGPVTVTADEISEIRLRRSSMGSTPPPRPAAYFGNITVENFRSSTIEVSFKSDGTATKYELSEKTVNGVKTTSGPARYVVNIGADAFRKLAEVLVENDFANEPRSRDITSLPISVTLTVIHAEGEKVIEASNMDKDTPELTAILEAIDDLQKRTDWEPGKQ